MQGKPSISQLLLLSTGRQLAAIEKWEINISEKWESYFRGLEVTEHLQE